MGLITRGGIWLQSQLPSARKQQQTEQKSKSFMETILTVSS